MSIYMIEVDHSPASDDERCSAYSHAEDLAIAKALDATTSDAIVAVHKYTGGRRYHVLTIFGRRAYEDLQPDYYCSEYGLAVAIH